MSSRWKKERADSITSEFDAMYSARARTAASILSDNPELIDIDSLNSLDHALDGYGLRVFDIDGTVLASDELLHRTGHQHAYGQADSGRRQRRYQDY